MAEPSVDERCACGRPLHYSHPGVEAYIRAMIAELGERVTVTVEGIGSYRVPRHYIALHGLVAAEIGLLADEFGFEFVGR